MAAHRVETVPTTSHAVSSVGKPVNAVKLIRHKIKKINKKFAARFVFVDKISLYKYISVFDCLQTSCFCKI